MVIPRTFIETAIPHTRKGWRVAVHVRPRTSIFTRVRYHHFPTHAEADQWARKLWLEGNQNRRRTNRGFVQRLTTRTVMWVRDDLIPTGPYEGLPEFRAVRHTTGLTLWIEGVLVAEGLTSGRAIKRAILRHPEGSALCARVCACGRLPKIDLAAGTLTHDTSDCPVRIHMPADPLTPPPLQIAVWNRYFSRRRRVTKLLPMTRPHFMILGALREPSERDMMRKIRAVEVIPL